MGTIVKPHTPDDGADIVIDAVGTLLGQALGVVASGGQVVVFGIDERADEEVRPFLILYKDVTVIGSQLAKDTFQDVTKAFELPRAGDAVKAQLIP